MSLVIAFVSLGYLLWTAESTWACVHAAHHATRYRGRHWGGACLGTALWLLAGVLAWQHCLT